MMFLDLYARCRRFLSRGSQDATGVHVVSLINNEPQKISSGGYRLLRFPYRGESYDRHGMHAAHQPDGGVSAFPDDRSALIWPSRKGLGLLEANIHWEAASVGIDLPDIPGIPDWMKKGHRYTELRDRFVRDPLDLMQGEPGDEGEGGNSTATDHRALTPGGQFYTKCHMMFVHPDVPLAAMVAHNANESVKVTHAQFKLAIWPVT